MRELLFKMSKFAWDSTQETPFAKVKDMKTKSPGTVLDYFAKVLFCKLTPQNIFIWANLLQEGNPVLYASKSLTSSEIN